MRTETRIAYNSVSVSYAAVELAKKELEGLKGRKALIFGAGKMAALTAQHLHSHGMEKIYVANRHIEEVFLWFNPPCPLPIGNHPGQS